MVSHPGGWDFPSPPPHTSPHPRPPQATPDVLWPESAPLTVFILRTVCLGESLSWASLPVRAQSERKQALAVGEVRLVKTRRCGLDFPLEGSSFALKDIWGHPPTAFCGLKRKILDTALLPTAGAPPHPGTQTGLPRLPAATVPGHLVSRRENSQAPSDLLQNALVAAGLSPDPILGCLAVVPPPADSISSDRIVDVR